MVLSFQVKDLGLQLLTGRNRFRDYNPAVNPTIPNSVAAAALRFGHSTIRNQFSRFGDMHRVFPSINVKDFHNPEFIYEVNNGGIDGILRGLALDPAQNIDGYGGLMFYFILSDVLFRLS